MRFRLQALNLFCLYLNALLSSSRHCKEEFSLSFYAAHYVLESIILFGMKISFSSFHTQQKERSQRFNRRKYFISLLLCTFVSAWSAAPAHCTFSLYSKTSSKISVNRRHRELRKNCGIPSLWLLQTVCALSLHAVLESAVSTHSCLMIVSLSVYANESRQHQHQQRCHDTASSSIGIYELMRYTQWDETNWVRKTLITRRAKDSE